MVRLICNGKDISNYVSTLTWSGGVTEVARKLEISLINSDKLGKLKFSEGNKLVLYKDSTELFQGYAFTKEWGAKNKVINSTVYDGLVYLVKSNATYNFKRISPEDITRKVCKDFDILSGELPSTGITINHLFQDVNVYEILKQIWTKAHLRTGKIYMPIMRDGKLNIIEKGSKIIDFNTNYVLDTSSSESIEEMVNRVRIYNEKGKNTGKVENEAWVKNFGILQQTYAREKDKNAVDMAKNILKGIQKNLTLEGIGDIGCISGNALRVKITNGISGLFYIDSDTHTFENGSHKMSLTLNYQNIMDEAQMEESK